MKRVLWLVIIMGLMTSPLLAQEPKLLKILDDHPNWINSLAFSPMVRH